MQPIFNLLSLPPGDDCQSTSAPALCVQVWYDYARWQADSGGGVGQATACLQRAVHALPNCLLLFFALADLYEAQGDVAAAKQVCAAAASLSGSCNVHREMSYTAWGASGKGLLQGVQYTWCSTLV